MCIVQPSLSRTCLTLSQFEAGSRMILDAILITLAKITGKMCPAKKVAILPEMTIGPSEGIYVTNVHTGFELYLTGSLDYGILLYDDQREHRGWVSFSCLVLSLTLS